MPARGYADYQRVTNWDSELIISENAAEHTGRLELGRFETSRYSSVMGKMQFSKHPVQVNVKWYMTETGGEPISERTWYMDSETPVSADLCIPCGGPWMEIVLTPEELTQKWNSTVRLLLTNRVLPGVTIARSPAVLRTTIFKLAGHTAKVFAPEMFYAGPAELYMEASLSGFNASIFAMLKGYSYEYHWAMNENPLVLTTKVILPFTAQQFHIENATASENSYVIGIIPSVTGAS